MQRKHLVVATAAGLGLVGAIAYAANVAGILPSRATAPAAASPQLPATASRSEAAAGDAAQAFAKASGPTAKPDEISDATVGDADSFGRNVRWLGLAAAYVQASTDCAAIVADDPTAQCQQIANLAANTSFAFNDIARIELPAKASNSLFCHWFSPRVQVYFLNPTAAPVPGRFSYNPTLTLENAVLDDPSLINPVTGAPFNGSLTTGMSASESVEVVVDPTYPTSQNLRDSVVCQDGLISKRALMQTYGLSQAQANKFFTKSTTVRLNVSGSTRFVDYAQFLFGLRIVGD
ncbi:MAG TPA: hypothetical protein VLC71_03635 [Thermomonas sp.]|nr:hypothetical protein [Thermomonas sp.]